MHMSRKTALLDYNLCQPEKCDSGECSAARACALKLIRQEAPYTIPLTEPFYCRACGDCMRACPVKAIKISNM